MKLDRVLLAIVVALWALTLGIMLVPVPEGALGMAHPDHATLRHGGSGLDRHGALLWIGWAFGGLGIVFYAALMAFGARAAGHRGARARWLVLGLLAFLGAWTWLVMSYRAYMIVGPGRLFFGFPLPTAVMLYVLFPASLIFTVAYVVGFRRWVLSEEDEAAWERLLAEARGRSTPGESGDGGTH